MLACLLLGALSPALLVDSVFARQAWVAARVCSLSYRAEYRYVEEDRRSGRRQELRCTRRVSMAGYENQRHDFERVLRDGRELSGEEMQRAIRDLESKGLVAGKTRMPFLVETRAEYRYRLLGGRLLGGRPVWLLGFEPVRASDRHVRGRAFILADNWDIARLEFRPARVPFVVKEMELALDYEPVGEYWLPVRFRFELELWLHVVARLLDRHITIEDDYSDFRLFGPGGAQ
jgi:hypothetical protein